MRPDICQEVYRVSNLKHRYGQNLVLDLGRLSIGRGSILGLVGPNGSGKSTLLRILALVEGQSEGSLEFDGRPADLSSVADRRRVSMLFQQPYLLKRSVFDNVAFGLRLRAETADLGPRVDQALDWVGLAPSVFARRAWHELSGGEAQRVALASRLILRPEVLLLDEPTASVDAASAALIKEASVRARQEWGATLVIASHDLDWLEEVSDEIIYLFKGAIVETGLANLVAGPWTPGPDGLVRRVLEDGQTIVAALARGPGQTAVIDPSEVALHSGRPSQKTESNALRGRISRLGLEPGPDRGPAQVVATVSVSGHAFSVRLDRAQALGLGIFPGQEVWLTFEAGSIRWL